VSLAAVIIAFMCFRSQNGPASVARSGESNSKQATPAPHSAPGENDGRGGQSSVVNQIVSGTGNAPIVNQQSTSNNSKATGTISGSSTPRKKESEAGHQQKTTDPSTDAQNGDNANEHKAFIENSIVSGSTINLTVLKLLVERAPGKSYRLASTDLAALENLLALMRKKENPTDEDDRNSAFAAVLLRLNGRKVEDFERWVSDEFRNQFSSILDKKIIDSALVQEQLRGEATFFLLLAEVYYDRQRWTGAIESYDLFLKKAERLTPDKGEAKWKESLTVAEKKLAVAYVQRSLVEEREGKMQEADKDKEKA